MLPESSEGVPDTNTKPKVPAKPNNTHGAQSAAGSATTTSKSSWSATPNQEESLTQQDESVVFQKSPSKRAASLSSDVLRARYPRLLESIASTATIVPRVRPVTWLLKLIEDIYDALLAAMLPANEVQDVGGAEETSSFASPRPESMTATDTPPYREAGRRSRGTNAVGRLALPLFARTFIQHALGLPSLAEQDCLDLAFNVELRREQLPQVALFSNFLRELLDGDALLFFLVVRSVAQRELRLQLSSKEKLARTSSSAKQYVRGDLFDVVPHPLIPDGTKQVHLSAAGCESVMRRLFAYTLELRRTEPAAAVPVPSVLAQFVAAEALGALFLDGRTATIEDVFAHMVELFRSVSEDIVAQFKYNDDGTVLAALTDRHLLCGEERH